MANHHDTDHHHTDHHTGHHNAGHHHPGQGHAGPGTDDPAMAELLDLDGEIQRPHMTALTAHVADLADAPPLRLLDLGAGTGTGTFALLERFPGAEAIAVDASEPMLRHLDGKARERGVRVRTVVADLEETWPQVGTVDLVWASASLHHLTDPDRVLAEVFAALRPGGLLVAVEMDHPPAFLPGALGVGPPGLEERLRAIVAERQAAEMPLLGADWGPRLVKAGFTVEAERPFAAGPTPPLPAAGRHTQLYLRRIRSRVADRLSAEDLAALDTLLHDEGPGSVLRRHDLTVQAARTVWIGRRPGDTPPLV